MPKKVSKRGQGYLFQKVEGGEWHMQYYRRDPESGQSKRIRERTHTTNRIEARNKLNARLTQVVKGEQFIVGRPTTVTRLYQALREHVQASDMGRRALEELEWRWEHLKPMFGHLLVTNISTALINKYKTQRHEKEHAAKATVNRELGTLRRMFSHGMKEHTPPLVHHAPHIAMFDESDNVRKGFVEPQDYERMAAESAKDGLWLRLLVEFAWTYGWRRGEMVGYLRVRHVTFGDGGRTYTKVSIDAGDTKNGEPRYVVVRNANLESMLHAACDGKALEDFVLTRADGRPVKDFRGAWSNMCVRAGVGRWECTKKCGASFEGSRTRCKCGARRRYIGRLFHDMRRSAAMQSRNAGIPESVIMAEGGWLTSSMFRRYARVDETTLARAADRREAYRNQFDPAFDPSGAETAQKENRKEEGRIQ